MKNRPAITASRSVTNDVIAGDSAIRDDRLVNLETVFSHEFGELLDDLMLGWELCGIYRHGFFPRASLPYTSQIADFMRQTRDAAPPPPGQAARFLHDLFSQGPRRSAKRNIPSMTANLWSLPLGPGYLGIQKVSIGANRRRPTCEKFAGE
jgi:hypothetical protein